MLVGEGKRVRWRWYLAFFGLLGLEVRDLIVRAELLEVMVSFEEVEGRDELGCELEGGLVGGIGDWVQGLVPGLQLTAG